MEMLPSMCEMCGVMLVRLACGCLGTASDAEDDDAPASSAPGDGAASPPGPSAPSFCLSLRPTTLRLRVLNRRSPMVVLRSKDAASAN